MTLWTDVKLGLRLSVGGGRISGSMLLRLAMTTTGIALAVAVLLSAASFWNVLDERAQRHTASLADHVERPGVDALYLHRWMVDVRGTTVHVRSVAASGPASPVPPGLSDVPAPGELVVSPAVLDLLDSSAGAALRARLPGTVSGVIDKPGLMDADSLLVFSGSEEALLAEAESTEEIYAFGWASAAPLDPSHVLMLATLAMALLVPLLVFVTTASRMGAAERDRRLAALRLIGADARRVRMIAATDVLVGAFAGLVAGWVLFLAVRPQVDRAAFFGARVFADDVVPSGVLASLIAVLVPVLAVGAAVFGLRRTIVEPLGVVRRGKPIRRRMGWRWAITFSGAALLASSLFASPGSTQLAATFVITVGSGLLLIGVAALLPWVVERLVGRLRGGTPSWQLAIRRLQLDSGTASRVVSGLVVVLAGTILIQGVLAALMTQQEIDRGTSWRDLTWVTVGTDDDTAPRVLDSVRDVAGVREVHQVRTTSLTSAHDRQAEWWRAEVGTCAAFAAQADLPECADGDVFVVAFDADSDVAGAAGPPAGRIRLGSDPDAPEWTVPATMRPVPDGAAVDYLGGTLLITEGALEGVQFAADHTTVYVRGGGDADAFSDQVAAAVNQLAWRADVHPAIALERSREQAQERVAAYRATLLAASLIVLAVAALSLLMLAVEQITERRRPLAALAAAGVPLGVLARSSLWQNAIPVLVGVALAVIAGLGLTAPLLRLADVPYVLDMATIAGLATGAVLAVLLVTLLSMPLLRQATKLEFLRAE